MHQIESCQTPQHVKQLRGLSYVFTKFARAGVSGFNIRCCVPLGCNERGAHCDKQLQLFLCSLRLVRQMLDLLEPATAKCNDLLVCEAGGRILGRKNQILYCSIRIPSILEVHCQLGGDLACPFAVRSLSLLTNPLVKVGATCGGNSIIQCVLIKSVYEAIPTCDG